MDIDQRTVAMGVVVQTLVHADVSGVLFTANPSSGDRSELVVNSSFGLGEAVVWGQVTPDTYVLDRTSFAIKETRIGTKDEMTVAAGQHGTTTQPVRDRKRNESSLSAETLRELASMSVDVDRDFRFAGPRWHLYTPESRRAHEILFGAQSCSSRGRHLSPRRRSTDWRPCFQGISQTPLHTCALSSPRGLRCTRPRVSLPALAAPRSSSACRRRAAGSDALLPAAASSTGHASRAGPRSSPAAAGDS